MRSLWVTWLFGLLLLTLEGPALMLLDARLMTLQIALVLTAYAGLRHERESSTLLMLGWLLPMDWLGAGPPGLHALGLVVAFFALRLVAPRVQRQWSLGKAMLTGAAALLYHLALAAFLLVTAPSSPLLAAVLATLPQGALTACLVSLVIGRLLARVERAFKPRRDDGYLDS